MAVARQSAFVSPGRFELKVIGGRNRTAPKTASFDRMRELPTRTEAEATMSSRTSAEFASAKTYHYQWKTRRASPKYWVEIDLSDQVLVLHNRSHERYFLVSTGNKNGGPGYSATPTGEYRITCQIALCDYGSGDDVTPNVPWSTGFIGRSYFIHGAYWHNDFGHVRSHGCVNMKPNDARVIYRFFEAHSHRGKVIAIHK
jgi:lipoprotein-anchoring transpeptidase ErfK/SrfK